MQLARPFEDGNGRLARALTDMALAQDEHLAPRYYSLSARIMTEQDAYYEILERTQKGSLDVTPWMVWFLACYRGALADSETIIGRVLIKARFWQEHAAMELSGRQRKVISSAGLTTRHYVGMTKASRATAYREMSDLVRKGLLKHHTGQGRNVRYLLTLPQ